MSICRSQRDRIRQLVEGGRTLEGRAEISLEGVDGIGDEDCDVVYLSAPWRMIELEGSEQSDL
jgi:hypothetical protein